MKRSFITLIVALIAIVTLSAAPIEYIWSWKTTDPDIKFFRYHTDVEEEWKTVDTKSFRAHFFYDGIAPHTFSIQQSYDGENWSETVEKSYTPIYEKELDIIDEKFNKQSLSLILTPYQSYVQKNAPDGSADFMSVYSFGAEINATQYYGQTFGIMFSGMANMAYRDMSFDVVSGFYDAFAGIALRLIANKSLDLSLKGALGLQAEQFSDEWTVSPAVYGSVNASIRINKHLYLLVSPAVVYVNPGLFDKTNTFNTMAFREVGVGFEFQQ